MIRKRLALPYNKALLTQKRDILKRIYLNMPLHGQGLFPLDDAAFHHLCRVLRCRDGEALTVFNGDGNDYLATLQVSGKKQAAVQINQVRNNQRESPLHTILIQGLSKGERMDIALQKAVELGVNEIFPVKTQFCAVKLDDERIEKKQRHWRAIIVAACEQCQRAVLPILHPLNALEHVLPDIDADNKWVLHPYATTVDDSEPVPTPQQVAVLIGPEGGLSDADLDLAIQYDFTPKTLGKRILRTETAAMAALAATQLRWGDWHV